MWLRQDRDDDVYPLLAVRDAAEGDRRVAALVAQPPPRAAMPA